MTYRDKSFRRFRMRMHSRALQILKKAHLEEFTELLDRLLKGGKDGKNKNNR